MPTSMPHDIKGSCLDVQINLLSSATAPNNSSIPSASNDVIYSESHASTQQGITYWPPSHLNCDGNVDFSTTSVVVAAPCEIGNSSEVSLVSCTLETAVATKMVDWKESAVVVTSTVLNATDTRTSGFQTGDSSSCSRDKGSSIRATTEPSLNEEAIYLAHGSCLAATSNAISAASNPLEVHSLRPSPQKLESDAEHNRNEGFFVSKSKESRVETEEEEMCLDFADDAEMGCAGDRGRSADSLSTGAASAITSLDEAAECECKVRFFHRLYTLLHLPASCRFSTCLYTG
ncbi:unnamed protein product [Protopolystoma xenopodis]|uniref:Uncharacterized protein n=1 Tax=Protopolystoma xenopodis TaxID=117903 RepID=A0A448WCH8_9PLAT|nr:unnamed protein product [Protopolystoma xenopodis]